MAKELTQLEKIKRLKLIYESLKKMFPNGSITIMIHKLDLEKMTSEWKAEDSEIKDVDGKVKKYKTFKYPANDTFGITLFTNFK